MKKEEKTAKSKEKIILSAIKLIGEKGYDAFTISSLCTINNISKGLMYHNFSGKDDLYLQCVKRCYTDLINFLQRETEIPNINEYIERRLIFFRENPEYARIFFESIIYTNNKLYEEIQEIRKDLVELNRKVYFQLIKSIKLRDGISEDVAMEHFNLIQNMLNGYLSSYIFRGKDIEIIVEEQEKNLQNMLDLIIYGIGKK